MINYTIYRAKFLYGRWLRLTAPVDVSLELASNCNQRCGYCYHADQQNLPFTKGFMSFKTAEKILYNASDLNVSSIKLNWKGESTLNPVFSNVAELGKSLSNRKTFIDRLTNSNFQFQTNRDDIFHGLMCQTKVKVSYDSMDAAVMEKQRALSNHAQITDNIDKFYHLKGRKTQLVIQAVRTKLNKDEDFSKMRKWWPDAEISIRDVVAGRNEKDNQELIDDSRDSLKRQPCRQAFSRLIFNWKGEAFPCCPDIGEHLRLGSIYKNNLDEIFNGQAALKLRNDLKTMKAFKEDPCKSCSSFETFKNGYKINWKS